MEFKCSRIVQIFYYVDIELDTADEYFWILVVPGKFSPYVYADFHLRGIISVVAKRKRNGGILVHRGELEVFVFIAAPARTKSNMEGQRSRSGTDRGRGASTPSFMGDGRALWSGTGTHKRTYRIRSKVHSELGLHIIVPTAYTSIIF